MRLRVKNQTILPATIPTRARGPRPHAHTSHVTHHSPPFPVDITAPAWLISSVTTPETTKSTLRRWTLILGVLQITVGCVVGFIPPSAVAWFRGIVMAHIELTANGVLMIAFGFLVTELRLGPAALKVWFTTLQIGTWANGAAGVTAAFLGASSKLMPTLNEKFPPPQGTDSSLVTGTLKLCGITIMIALFLTLYGLLRSKPSDKTATA